MSEFEQKIKAAAEKACVDFLSNSSNWLNPHYGDRLKVPQEMLAEVCAMSSPERQAETERNFAIQLDAAGPMAMIDGTEVGPYPAENNPDAMRLATHIIGG